MATEVYGASDDLIEIDGDIRAEGGTDNGMVIFNDGTVLIVSYGKAGQGIWRVECLHAGELFDRIEECDDEDAERYSDTAHLKDGAKWAYIAKQFERAR